MSVTNVFHPHDKLSLTVLIMVLRNFEFDTHNTKPVLTFKKQFEIVVLNAFFKLNANMAMIMSNVKKKKKKNQNNFSKQ